MTSPAQQEVIAEFYRDRWLAHQILFARRHPDQCCEAHEALVRRIYDPGARRLIEGFRGIGKSTYLEEAALIKAGFREFKNMVIVGASYSRACDRLAAIKREINTNDMLENLFGQLRGPVWQEGKIVLSNGVCIQALGRDQSMLGIKFEDHRPDAALVDDVEDPEEVRTDDDRVATWTWFIKTFILALEHPLFSWVGVLGTRRGNGSLPERLEKAGWPTLKLPVEHIDSAGERRATWPAKFPLPVIDEMVATYAGDMDTWMQEMMCQPVSISTRVFRADMIRVEHRERSWHPVYAFIDPARTTNRNSASTGWAVWSWIANRLVIWAAGAAMLKPDEIIDLAFTICDEFGPVEIGIEEDGLNEWLKQPIRQEQLKRRKVIPFAPHKAPRSKLDFIKGLQPYYNAGEVVHAGEFPDFVTQLLAYPTGKIDGPNALAFALLMKREPVYENFTSDHIVRDLEIDRTRPLYLAANATRSMVAAALVQYIDGHFRIYADWIVEGAPEEIVGHLHAEAAMEGDTGGMRDRPAKYDWTEALKLPVRRQEYARLPVRWITPPPHFDRWNNVGLNQAVAHIPATLAAGASTEAGRAVVRGFCDRVVRGRGAVVVSDRAGWTIRGFLGGYSRDLDRRGRLGDGAVEGPYRLLMEAVESIAGMLSRAESQDAVDDGGNYSVDRHGRRYLSAMPAR